MTLRITKKVFSAWATGNQMGRAQQERGDKNSLRLRPGSWREGTKLTALATLAEDVCSVSSTHARPLTTNNLSSKASVALFQLPKVLHTPGAYIDE